jgi:hypothetical protein
MSDVARHSAVEPLLNGWWIEIRALRPDDRHELLAAINRTSAQSLYRRFRRGGGLSRALGRAPNPSGLNRAHLEPPGR